MSRSESPGDAHGPLAYLIAGIGLYGGLGWLLDRWLETGFLLPVGLIVGFVLSVLLIVRRYGRY